MISAIHSSSKETNKKERYHMARREIRAFYLIMHVKTQYLQSCCVASSEKQQK